MNTQARRPITDSLYSKGPQSIKIPGNGIAEPGVNAIKLSLAEWGLPRLPSEWNWEWRVAGKGEYVGALPKRIGKFYYQEHTTRLTPDQLTVIGNLGSRHSNKDETHHFDIVDKIEWCAGDFGDGGSCFWSCHAGAKDMILDNGGGAVRFFNGEEAPYNRQGVARAWVAPRPDGCLLVFNGYGMETIAIARILAAHFDHSYYRRVSLQNNGLADGSLWVNGGMGYLIGPQAVVTSVDAIDLEWEEYDSCRCARCEEAISEDTRYHSPDGDDYCESCYSDHVFCCESCNEDHWLENASQAPGDGDLLCEDCYSDSVRYCEHCESDIWESDAKEDPDGDTICEDCYSDKVAECEYCGGVCWTDDSQMDPDGDPICKDCHTEQVVECTECGEEVWRKFATVSPMGDDICAECDVALRPYTCPLLPVELVGVAI